MKLFVKFKFEFRGIDLQVRKNKQANDPRVRTERLQVAGLKVAVASIYGDCENQEVTRGLMNGVLKERPTGRGRSTGHRCRLER